MREEKETMAEAATAERKPATPEEMMRMNVPEGFKPREW